MSVRRAVEARGWRRPGGYGRGVRAAGLGSARLLARLAMEPGRVVPADVLTAAIWDERPPSGGAKALQARVARGGGLRAVRLGATPTTAAHLFLTTLRLTAPKADGHD